MPNTAERFLRLTREVGEADRIAYPLAELNDLLTAAAGQIPAKQPPPKRRWG
jgi:hypothetical protein